MSNLISNKKFVDLSYKDHDIDDDTKKILLKDNIKKYDISNKRIRMILLSSLIALVLGGVYEIFSHGVYSPFMYMIWAIPLIFGLVPIVVSKKFDILFIKSQFNFIVYFTGIVSIMIYSFFKGVLEIYGTDSKLVISFLILGIMQIAYGIFSIKK